MMSFNPEQIEGMVTNRANWDSRVPVHLGPNGYRVELLVEDPDRLTDVVGFDRDRLGDLTGLDVLHLQCHIGTDTISLARLGAASITGLDFSPEAIAAATKLAADCGQPARFVEGNVYDAVDLLGRTYDLVYTGVGAINWLPDIGRWAEVVAGLLAPGGRFHITEGHPSALVLSDDATPDNLQVAYPYFEGAPAMHFNESTSYLGDGTVASPETVEWSHNLAAIIQALIDAGLVIDRFEEHRELPWLFLPWMEPAPDRDGWYRFPSPLANSIPLSFTLQAHRPADR